MKAVVEVNRGISLKQWGSRFTQRTGPLISQYQVWRDLPTILKSDAEGTKA